MAVMCERITLPPISSLDFAFTSANARPRQGRDDRTLRGPEMPLQPSAHYTGSSSWDAPRPSTSGHPLPLPQLQHDVRPRPSAYDISPPVGAGLPSPPSSATQRRSPHLLGDRHPAPATTATAGLTDDHHRHLSQVSHVRTSSQLSAASVDTWSQYDSEHPDSPHGRVRSLSPPRAPSYASTPPGHTRARSDEMRFVHALPSAAQIGSSPGKKRKMSTASSEDEGGLDDDIPDEGKRAPRDQADGRRKYKKMMNVRHYRAQTKDALQSLRDVLPESIRPLERQARSFTVVNAVKHIENLTVQLEKLRVENREQAERLQRADRREMALTSRIEELERQLASKEEQRQQPEEPAPAAEQEGDA